jgi:SAM-dependent methyltransferase
MSEPAYVFDGTKYDAEFERLRALEAVFDGGTRRALLSAGLSQGWRCVEIGAGAGSVATWISDAVGPAGRVEAVDINARFLSHVKRANVDVHEADIRSVALEPASFDLAHARFVFIHLPDWQAAMAATLRLLKPGGRLVVEEPDFSMSRALTGPTELRRAFEHVHRAIEAMFAGRTMDFAFGARLPAILEEYGLGEVALENDAPIVPGGSRFAKMMGMSANQLREKYLATGLATGEDIRRYGDFTTDRSCWATYHGTIRAIGRKPLGRGAV